MPTLINKKRRRPRLRFSLRALMLVITVVCLWLGYQVSAARTQQHVVEQLRALGAQVSYRDEMLASAGQPPATLGYGLESGIGIDHFDTVVAVKVQTTGDPELIMSLVAQLPHLNSLTIVNLSLSDQDLRYLRSLRNLQSLELMLCRLGKDTLRQLAHCKALRNLSLNACNVLADDLAALANLSQLEHLDLSADIVDDQHLAAICQFKSLRELELTACQVSDHGLRHIGQLQELRRLEITSGFRQKQSIGDAGLRELTVLRHLEVLTVGTAPGCWGSPTSTIISAAGLRQLAHLPLKTLNVHAVQMGDDDLEWLTGIPTLETLGLYGTQVTATGKEYLSKNLPKLKQLDVDRGNFGVPITE